MVTVEPVTAEPPPWARRTVMRQRWEELAYFHWAYDPAEVQRLLPDGLLVDTFDDAAWVGLIPFEMRDISFGPAPAVPYLGSFVEINVRTYVTDRLGRRSVWFLSLDIPRQIPVAVARSVFGLPYCWSRTLHTVDGERHRYRFDRRWPRSPQAHAEMAFTVAEPIAPADETPFEHWSAARWGLATTRRRRLLHGGVTHGRWPLHRVTDVEIDESAFAAGGLSAPTGAPHARYSPGVAVELAWLEPLPTD